MHSSSHEVLRDLPATHVLPSRCSPGSDRADFEIPWIRDRSRVDHGGTAAADEAVFWLDQAVSARIVQNAATFVSGRGVRIGVCGILLLSLCEEGRRPPHTVERRYEIARPQTAPGDSGFERIAGGELVTERDRKQSWLRRHPDTLARTRFTQVAEGRDRGQ
jgi:hypothetical protein